MTIPLRCTGMLVALMMMACGDRCERLCRDVSFRLESCVPDAWEDLGARNRSDFVLKCRAEWDRRSRDLTSSNVSEAIRVCGDARDVVGDLSCDQIEALYLP